MRSFGVSLLVFAGAVAAAAQGPVPVGNVQVSAPATIASLDMGKLKGEPSRLAWSPDGSQLYVQTLEGGFGMPGAKLRHYIVAVNGGAVKDLQVEPEWLSPYWTEKSGQASPDVPGLKVDLKTEQRTERTTSAPMGGDLARGGTTTAAGASGGDAASAAYTAQTVQVITLKLLGESIGEFVNAALVPGLTFAWGPKGSQAIAFTTIKDGKVVLMNVEGKKQEIAGTKEAVLPAWSAGASRLAWLQKDGRKKYDLRVVTLGR
jgi:hypothetical protein